MESAVVRRPLEIPLDGAGSRQKCRRAVVLRPLEIPLDRAGSGQTRCSTNIDWTSSLPSDANGIPTAWGAQYQT